MSRQGFGEAEKPIRERRGHIDAEERPMIVELQQFRSQGKYEEADRILGQLLIRYEHAIDAVVYWLEQQGEDREDAWFAARAVLARQILDFDPNNMSGDLSSFVNLIFNGGQVQTYMRRQDVRLGRRGSAWIGGITGLSDVEWTKQLAREASEFIDLEEVLRFLRELVARLPEKQRIIIERRYNLDSHGGATLEEVASELGVTRQYVNYLESRAINKLRLMSLGHPLLSVLNIDDEHVRALLERLGGKPYGGYIHPVGSPGKRKKKP